MDGIGNLGARAYGDETSRNADLYLPDSGPRLCSPAPTFNTLSNAMATQESKAPRTSILPEAAGSAPARVSFASGLGAFAENYDLFLVDQWGVLHDGKTAYPGVAECLRRLSSRGKRVVILSNSGKRTQTNALQLATLGIPADAYTALITSGEVARHCLSVRTPPFSPSLGNRCLLLNSDGDGSLVDGLNLELTPTVAAADFILLSGVGDDHPMMFYLQLLEDARARHLPLVCVNPDLLRLSRGGLVFSAGEVARHYERMGGQVHYVGKPYPLIYDYCRKVLPDFEASRAMAVGDSYFHDVRGGARFGLATAFVTGGIHRPDFPDEIDEADRVQRLADFAREHEVWPDWVIPRFRW